MVFKAFEDDASILIIHGDVFTVTNDPERVALSVTLEVLRDKRRPRRRTRVAADLREHRRRAATRSRVARAGRRSAACADRQDQEPVRGVSGARSDQHQRNRKYRSQCHSHSRIGEHARIRENLGLARLLFVYQCVIGGAVTTKTS